MERLQDASWQGPRLDRRLGLGLADTAGGRAGNRRDVGSLGAVSRKQAAEGPLWHSGPSAEESYVQRAVLQKAAQLFDQHAEEEYRYVQYEQLQPGAVSDR